MRAHWRFAACTLLCTTAVQASETITYSYDARGRLVTVARVGSVNNGVSACYAYDKADNRTNVTVASTSCASPLLSFAIDDVSVAEGEALVFTVMRNGATSLSQTVNYSTSGGTATAGTDFTTTSGALTFAPGDASKAISVSTIADLSAESAETFFINLSGATGGATITDSQGVGTINDPPARFSINDVSATEGGSLAFTVTKTGTSSSSFSVNYAAANGTATAGSDYTAASGTLTFAAADTTKTITIATTNDTSVENAETVLVNLSGVTGGATITDSQGAGTINDNDNQPPVANPDTLTVVRCETGSKNVVANDTDPDGHTPLVVTAVSHPEAWVASSTTVGVQAPDSNGSFSVTYTVRDSLGATDTATLTVTVTGTVCP